MAAKTQAGRITVRPSDELLEVIDDHCEHYFLKRPQVVLQAILLWCEVEEGILLVRKAPNAKD